VGIIALVALPFAFSELVVDRIKFFKKGLTKRYKIFKKESKRLS